MKNLSLLLLATVFAFYGCSSDDEKELPTPPETPKEYQLTLPTLKSETEYRGEEATQKAIPEISSEESTYYKNTISSQVFSFNTYYSSSWGFAGGFEFTNLTTGNYSSVPKKGVNNSTYITYYEDTWNADQGHFDQTIYFSEQNKSDLRKGYTVKGMYLTNSVFGYNCMTLGDGMTQPDAFGKDDFFKITIYNLDKSKQVEVYLANGTDILTTWKWVDLTALGTTTGLKFKMSSSRNNDYGMTTAACCCMDGITLIKQPVNQ